MKNKIEAIIEWLNMDWLLPANKKDQQLARQILEDLLPEEKEVEIKINKHSNIVNINCSLCKHATFWNETVLKSYKYCPWCWAKIKRVD